MSKKPKLTPWFPAGVRPVRVGRYEVKRKTVAGYPSLSFLIWTGSHWVHTEHSTGNDARMVGRRAAMIPADRDKWRGLAENPSPGARHEVQP